MTTKKYVLVYRPVAESKLAKPDLVQQVENDSQSIMARGTSRDVDILFPDCHEGGVMKMPPATTLPPSDQGLTMGPSSAFSIPAQGIRRKTPSELRQEQLKRNVRLRTGLDGEPSVIPSQGSTTDPKKISPRMIDTRVADIFAATKPHVVAHERPKFSLTKQMVEALMAPLKGQRLKECGMKPADLATGPDSLSYDVDAIACKSRTPPVDLSLKISARFLSADSLHWCHRTSFANEVDGLSQFVKKHERDKESLAIQHEGCAEKQIVQRFGAQFCQALFSWVHPSPQYSGLYDMLLTATRGDTRKDPQLTTLYQMWEDSFSSLYYMFHRRRCNQFYYCTQQFVVMFAGGDIEGTNKNALNAYWTRSTRGLRRLLKEHGVEFLVPFSSQETDTTTIEELQELTEFEQSHPGQTRPVDSSAVIDNSALSLLVFEGKNVHRLFDFLLNYRFLVGSANAKEFPTLYSPVEFKAATLHAPEVKCKRAEYDSSAKNQLIRNTSGRRSVSVTEMMYSLELKDAFGAYIPPWVIQGVCNVLQETQSTGFEASFNTGPLTEILNVAHSTKLQEAGRCLQETDPNSQLSKLQLSDIKNIAGEVRDYRGKVVKQLKFSGGFYETSVN